MLENMIHSYIYIYANKILKRLNAPKCRMVVRSEETTEKYSKYKETSIARYLVILDTENTPCLGRDV